MDVKTLYPRTDWKSTIPRDQLVAMLVDAWELVGIIEALLADTQTKRAA